MRNVLLVTLTPLLIISTASCTRENACVPDCGDRICGLDPECGVSCGECSTNETCNSSGQCECTYTGCNGTCCPENQVCHAGSCCTPDCIGRDCGSEPVCGSSCGSCADYFGLKNHGDVFVQEGEGTADLFTQSGSNQVDVFVQGGFYQVDTFKQKAAGQVDILWVVDNSWSMGEEQTNLANNFSSFMTHIDQSQMDYHIGVISTDMNDPSHSGKLLGTPKIVTRATPDPVSAFAANVQVGTNGWDNEMGLLAAHDALTEPLITGDNAGFLRPDATMSIIFVSDEDDKSYGGTDFYVRFFGSLKEIGNENNVIITAIVAPDPIPGGCEAYIPGNRYNELVTDLGGTTASICDTDFASMLQQLGLTATGLSRKFVLSIAPDPATLVVHVDEGSGFVEVPEFNAQSDRNWSLDPVEKAIYFQAYVPPPQSEIKLVYSNSNYRFPLSEQGEPSTIVVRVDDAEIPQTDDCWQYIPGENAIAFYGNCVPALTQTIEVSYSGPDRSFPLSRVVESTETIRVYIDLHDGNGFREIFSDEVNGWIFHAQTNSIHFQGSYFPPLGADLKVAYSYLIRIFPLSRIPRVETIVVNLDPDGQGPEPAAPVPEYDAGTSTPGWVYYGPEQAPPYANTISFENTDTPPFMSVVSAGYSTETAVAYPVCNPTGQCVECQTDTDCDAAHHCGDGGNCLCDSEIACEQDEHCNASGYCQKLSGCQLDADCGDPAEFRCQIEPSGRGVCLCRTDQACRENEFCNTSSYCQEEAGCMLDADCGNPDHWNCVIDPQTSIGECRCQTDDACWTGKYCNVHGFCQPVLACSFDEDCPAGRWCETSSGECRCDYDAQTGCASQEFCNYAGYCQPSPGCRDNTDCEHLADHYCDIFTRTCAPDGTCSSDRQCPLGEVCRARSCINGCNDSNDCLLDQCCNSFLCEPCECRSVSFCDIIHFCTAGQCLDAYSAQTPYCKPCDTLTEECGNASNRCVPYPYTNDDFAQISDDYCAIDCAADEHCPNGFTCSTILIIKSSDQCQFDSDCPTSLPCLKSPVETYGFCPCSDTLNPCPTDICNTLIGECINKKTPCTTSADCIIQCETYFGVNYGSCVLGKVCGLREGIHCPTP